MSAPQHVARVVIDSRLPQLNRLFDYRIPEGTDLVPGVRVRVPLRSAKRLAEGYVVERASGSEHPGSLASIAEVVSPVPVMPQQLWNLASGVAQRSAGSPADVLRLAIPKRYVKVEKAWWQDGRVLQASPPETPTINTSGTSDSYVDSVFESAARTNLSLPYGISSTQGSVPYPRSWDTLASVAAQGLQRGQSVLLVCPDWRDIEHARAALREVVPDHAVCEVAGEQPPAARYGEYLRTLEPTPLIVLGGRHAVYAPAHNLGLIVVVDDADQAHREPLAPYPHTRDVALLRNSLERVPVCFAGVTPSLAVRRWVDMGHVREVSDGVSQRARVIPTALALHHEQISSPARLPSSVYQAVKETLAHHPVLVQVFRSGYAPGLSCRSCKTAARCAQCGGPLRQTSPTASPSCLWCGVVAARWVCPECSAQQLQPRGQGIGRTVSDLGKSFPGIPLVRSDGDHRVSSVPRGPALVIATRGAEPVTPQGYPLVLLLDGAAMLQRSSLGALEETIQAWEHAISLASDDGVCFVTDLDGPPALALAAGNWSQLMRHELTQRTELKLPPTLRIASLIGPSPDVERVKESILQTSPLIDALGPVHMPEGGVMALVRFPYALGDAVVRELSAWRHKLASGPRRQSSERVKIVVDDALALDALAGE